MTSLKKKKGGAKEPADSTRSLCDLAEKKLSRSKKITRDMKGQIEELRESEAKFHTVADFTYDWELWLGPDKQILYCSPSCERITGYPPQAFITDPQLYTQIVYPDDRSLMEEHNRTAWETPEPRSVDFRIIHRDGSVRWIGHACQLVRDPDGTVRGRRISNREITERKYAEEELNRANRALRMLNDSNQAMIHITDETILMNEICRIAVEAGGYRLAWIGFAEQDEAKTVRPVAHAGFESGYIATTHLTWAEDSPRGRGPGGNAIRTGQISIARNISTDPAFTPWRAEAMLRGYESVIALPLTHNGQTIGVLGIYSREADVFDPKEVKILKELADDLAFGIIALRLQAQRDLADKAIRDLNAYNRSLIEASLDPLVTITPGGMISDVNAATMTVTGFSREELIGTDFSQYFTEPDRARAGYEAVFRDGVVKDYPLEIRHRDGQVTSVLYNATVYRDESGNIAGIFAAARDITERKKAEEREVHLASFPELTPVQILEADPDGSIRYTNPAMRRSLDALGETDPRIFIPQDILTRLDGTAITEYYHEERETEIHNRIFHEILFFTPEFSSVRIYASDITERKQAEDALRESHAKYRQIVENISDVILTLDMDGTVTYISPVIQRLFGYTVQEVVGRHFREFIHPEDVQRVLEGFRRRVAGEYGTNEFRLLTKDGRERYVRTTQTPIGKEGGVTGFNYVMTDYTERRKAEDALRHASAYNRSLIEASLDPLVTIGPEGKITDVNAATETATGYSRQQLIGTDFSDYFMNPENARAGYRQAFREGTVHDYPLELRHRDGHVTMVLYNASVFRDGFGNVTGIFAAARDITRLVEEERKLKESEERYRNVVQSQTEFITRFLPDGTHLFVNEAYCRYFGKPCHEMIAHVFRPEIPADDQAPLKQHFRSLTRDHPVGTIEHRIILSDGTVRWQQWNDRAIFDTGGNIAEYQSVGRDITERKMAEEMLRKFNEELEHQVRVRTEELNLSLEEKVLLLREIHHRVKNNLQIIISLVNLQMRRVEDERLKQVMAETQNRVRAMALVHEKLYQSVDISRIDLAGYTGFLVTHLFTFYGVDSRQVTREVDIGKIMLDINTAIPLGLIINELASNALKYAFPDSRKGSLSIAVREEGKTLHLMVRDDGIGMPEDFDWRNAESLGLRLVVSLVEQLDGTIELDRSAGTAFTIIVQEKK
nr:PAS domain S-box protein [uncultured Methanoregula sp.]